MPATAVVIKRAAARARRENTGIVTVLTMNKPLAGSKTPPYIVPPCILKTRIAAAPESFAAAAHP